MSFLRNFIFQEIVLVKLVCRSPVQSSTTADPEGVGGLRINNAQSSEKRFCAVFKNCKSRCTTMATVKLFGNTLDIVELCVDAQKERTT